MPRLRPGDGGVRCSPKAADVVDQVVDAPIAGQRGPATTSPARSSGTRRPPERAHVHPTEGDQGTLTRPHPQPRITRAPHEPPVDRPPRLFGSRGRRHRFRPPSALAVSHRPKAVDIDACRLAALAAASIRSWHRLAKRPRAGGFGPGHAGRASSFPDARRGIGCGQHGAGAPRGRRAARPRSLPRVLGADGVPRAPTASSESFTRRLGHLAAS